MKLFAIVCLALIAAVNARPGGGKADGLTGGAEALFDDYAGIKAARLSAGDIAKAGLGLDELEKLLKTFSGLADTTIKAAETTVEAVATPYDA